MASISDAAVRIRLTRYPTGSDLTGVWSVEHENAGALADGEVRVRLSHISVDPGMRGWITPKRSYMPPVELGQVMRAFGVGEVVETRSPQFSVGDWVTGFTGVQSLANLSAHGLRKVMPDLAPPHLFLSGLGMTGYTAYFGMVDVAQPVAGETVVVSAAAGAVGSIAAQIARIKGCRVIGIAGGPAKQAYLRETLKLDVALDYKLGNIAEQLASSAPNGIDAYFDNVGGETLDAVLGQINYRGRIAVCGGISQYSDMDSVAGPANYLQIIAQSVRMQGFTMRDYLDRIPEAFMAIAGWRAAGELVFREHIVEGIECFPEAYDMLFSGANEGKLLIRV